MFEANYVYTTSHARRALLQRWGYSGRSWLIALGVGLAVAVAGLFSSSYQVPSAFLVGLFLWPWLTYLRGYIRAGRGPLVGTTITLYIDEEGIAFSSALLKSAMPWSAVVEARLTRDFVFLVRSHTQATPVPRAALGTDALAFLQERTSTRRSGVGAL